jgi:hypothetical protein
MNTSKKTPPIVQAGAWLLSLIVFAIGFWHTHLGLKEMRPFGSEWGGLAIAGIVLLLILITYWYAVNGKKMALIFYVLGGIIFFVCNLNYFYPAYLTRQIVKEEATVLNDTLQNYANQANALQKTAGFVKGKEFDDYQRLKSLKNVIVTEVKGLNGFGANAGRALNEFNNILKEYGSKGISLTTDNRDKEKLANFYEGHLEAEIQNLLKSLVNKGSGMADAVNFLKGVNELDSMQRNYSVVLKDSIIPDNTSIDLEDVKEDPQINLLQRLVTGINVAVSKINNATKPDTFKFQPLEESRSRDLGRIANTFKSIKDRITKVDTWAIIILCLFVDLIVPLAIYLLLRKKEDEEDESIPQYSGPEKF